MISSPGNAPSSIDIHSLSNDGLLVNSTRCSSSSTSSGSTLPSKSSHTSIFLLSPPSSKPDENSPPISAPPKSMNGSSRRWSPHVSNNKRKRDSEIRSLNDLQLREAQEKVEQKRARIAARVPATTPGNARPASAPVTSLADLYAQMRRDSGASGQRRTSSVVPSTSTVSAGNGPILGSTSQNAPRGHSTSSPDPIALCEDDQEIVILRHAPGSRDKAKTSTPKSAVADGVPKLNFAVVVPSPPKHSTHKLRRVESKETIPDLTHEYGTRRSRRGMEDFTARDLDILLDAVPVPFDFSLAHHHLASREDGENDEQSEEGSLWWYHPIFEARAKADIRRTLHALLPSDPAQDPPFPVGRASGWKPEVRPRESRARIWAERLEDAFGPGPLDRGLGRKPRRVARPAGAAKREAAANNLRLKIKNGAGAVVVIPNSHRSTPQILEPPSRRRSPKDEAAVADEVSFRPPEADGVDVVSVDAANAKTSESESEAAAAWTAALLPLVKGKIMLDKTMIARTSVALGEVEHANKRGSFAREVLKESALGDTVRRLGELDSVPLGDIYRLRVRARTLAEQWREAFGDEVVDLQRGVLLHVS